MKKIHLPITLSLIVIFLSILFLSVNLSGDLDLTDSERLQFIINVFAACAAVISAIFVIWSYIFTNEAFRLSQKPQLLVQLTNDQNNFSQTIFRYINVTRNAFDDLAFTIEVKTPSKRVDMSDLFTRKMYMAGRDDRTRRFNSDTELKNRDIDLARETSAGNEVRLTIKYTFTFLGEQQSVLAQEYKWIDKQGWNLP